MNSKLTVYIHVEGLALVLVFYPYRENILCDSRLSADTLA